MSPEIHTAVRELYVQLRESGIGAGILPPMETFSASSENRRTFDAKGTAEDELLNRLLSLGMGLVSSGLHQQVIEGYARIPSAKWRVVPRHLLTIAYAYEYAGQPLQALTYAKSAIASAGEAGLTRSGLAIADLIRLNSESSIGLLNREQFFTELRAYVNRHATTPESVHARLQLILHDMVALHLGPAERDPMKRMREFFEEAKGLVERIDDDGSGHRWGATLLLARIEFQLATQLFMDGCFRINASRHMGHPIVLPKIRTTC